MALPKNTDPGFMTSVNQNTRNSINDFIKSLKTLTVNAEKDFMILGDGLQTVHSNVKDLTQLILNTANRIGGNDQEGMLARVTQIVNDSHEEIRDFNDEVHSNLNRINTVVGGIGELRETSEKIKKFAKFLKAVALNMLVENARTMDSANIFSDIAQEIKDLSINISGIANDAYDNVESAREIQLSIHRKISKGMGRLEGLTGDVHAVVRASVKETEELMNFSIQSIEQAGMRTREIARQVGEIVMGVQFHDNMRQRIEIMIDTLNRPDTMTGSVIRNQVSLFRDMRSEVDEVYHQNLKAMEEIEKEVEVLLESFLGFKSEDTGDELRGIMADEDPFLTLKSALMQLQGHLDQGRTLFEQLRGATAQAADIASNLSHLLSTIRDISSETQTKALNSIVAAQRLGERGRTLKLLAQEMKDLAARSDEFVSEADGIIESIVESATEIGQKNLKGMEAARTGSSGVTRLDAFIDNISNEYDQIKHDSEEAYDQAKTLRTAITGTMVGLDFFRALSKGMTHHQKRLVEIAGFTGDDFPAGEKPVVEKNGIVIPFSEVLKKRDDKDGFGNNVEIFE